MRAISAPRSQRVPITSRVTSSCCVIRRIWRALASGEPPGVTFCHVYFASAPGLDQSMTFIARLADWSSAANSDERRAALLEQPASLSSSA